MSRRAKIVLLVVAVAGFATAATLLPVHSWMTSVISWVRGAGLAGAAAFAAVYVVATVAFVPGSVLTMGAGFLYGPLWGLALVSPASVVAATVAFLLARGAARPWVRAKVEGDRRFRAIDEAVGREGLKIVLLLRLSPVFPFTFLNYALGLTGVTTGGYVLGSFVGMLPGGFLYVYLGSLIPNVADLAGGPSDEQSVAQQALLWGGLAATAVVTVYITRIARRALRRELPGPGPR